MRPERLAYDHCPQLEELAPEIEVRVTPEAYEPFVSRELSMFDFKARSREREPAGRRRSVLRWKDGCRLQSGRSRPISDRLYR